MILNTLPITKNINVRNKIDALAKEAFPPEEYLSPNKLVEMAQSDTFDFLALFDKNTFIGFMVVQTYKNLAYLFFLAIEPNYRSLGYGSSAIDTLKHLYPNKKHVVDFEMIDSSASNNAQRIRRKNFYLRNGYKETGLFLSYFGVDYEVLCSDNDFDSQVFKEMMANMQIDGFNPIYFKK